MHDALESLIFDHKSGGCVMDVYIYLIHEKPDRQHCGAPKGSGAMLADELIHSDATRLAAVHGLLLVAAPAKTDRVTSRNRVNWRQHVHIQATHIPQ